MRLSVKLALALLRRDLTLEERVATTSLLLDKNGALPLKEVFEYKDDGVFIMGKPADQKQLLALRESALQALENRAFNIIGEHVLWTAVQRGVHQAVKPEDLYFYRAAIWVIEQMKANLNALVSLGRESES